MAARTMSKRRFSNKVRTLTIHAGVFTGVLILLALIDWYFGDPAWVHWVFLGWGIGLAVHAGLVARCWRHVHR